MGSQRKPYSRKGVTDRLVYMASNAQLRYYQGILEEKNETVRRLGLGKSKHPDDLAQLDKLNALAYAAIQKMIAVQKIQAKCYDPRKAPKRCR